jgi:diguanylate cyclase (GGDEF)-like protein
MDTITVAIMSLAICVINAIVVTLMALRNRDLKGLLAWAFSLWFIIVGLLGALARVQFDLWVSVLISNVFIIGGLYLPYIGITQFLEKNSHWKVHVSVYLVCLATIMYFATIADSYRVRVVIAGSIITYIAFITIRAVYSGRQIPLARLIFITGFSLIGFINFVRVIEGLVASYDVNLFNSSIISNLVFVLILVGTWLYTYAMVIAPGEEKQFLLAELSERDSLTRILNRRAFIGRYEAREMTQDKHIAVMLIDIDFFKQVNDTHGHLIGDLVLKELSNYIRTTKRSSDVFARLGGEEFALFFEEKDTTHAMTMAHQLCERTAYHFKNNCPKLPDITFSAGVAVARSKVPIETLLFAADHYLYQAKNNGRNQVQGPL